MGVDLKFTRTTNKYPYMEHDTTVIAKGETLSDIPKDAWVHAIAWIKNIGDTDGYATLQIYNKTDSRWEGSGSSKTWVPAHTGDAHAIQRSCSMRMPDHDVDIELQVIWEEAAGKRWVHDREATFYLKALKKANMDIVYASMSPTTINAGENTTITTSIKNVGTRADTPHYKILAGGTKIDEFDDDAGALSPSRTRGRTFTFSILTAGTYTITLKAWAKADESEPA